MESGANTGLEISHHIVHQFADSAKAKTANLFSRSCSLSSGALKVQVVLISYVVIGWNSSQTCAFTGKRITDITKITLFLQNVKCFCLEITMSMSMIHDSVMKLIPSS